MLDIVIDKIYYTVGGISDAVGFINGIVSACTTSCYADDTLTCIYRFFLTATGKDKR